MSPDRKLDQGIEKKEYVLPEGVGLVVVGKRIERATAEGIREQLAGSGLSDEEIEKKVAKAMAQLQEGLKNLGKPNGNNESVQKTTGWSLEVE